MERATTLATRMSMLRWQTAALSCSSTAVTVKCPCQADAAASQPASIHRSRRGNLTTGTGLQVTHQHCASHQHTSTQSHARHQHQQLPPCQTLLHPPLHQLNLWLSPALDVTVHRFGISELSDVTVIATTDTATHHYASHKHVLASNSTYFHTLLLGDLSATTVTLPATICQLLEEWGWVLSRWYNPAATNRVEPGEQQLIVGDTVIYKDALWYVVSASVESLPGYVHIRPKLLHQDFGFDPTKVYGVPVHKVRPLPPNPANPLTLGEAEMILPLVVYLDCPLLLKKCENLLLRACSDTVFDTADKIKFIAIAYHNNLRITAARMLMIAIQPSTHLTVEHLIQYLSFAEDLQSTEAADTIADQLLEQTAALRRHTSSHPDWTDKLSVDCLRLLFVKQIMMQ